MSAILFATFFLILAGRQLPLFGMIQ